MDFWFARRIEEIKRMCAPDDVVYVASPYEMPGVCAADEVSSADVIIGRVSDAPEKLYDAWLRHA